MSIQTSEPGFTLKHLKADDYYEICGMREEFNTKPPDLAFAMFDGTTFQIADRVILPDGKRGTVSGIATEDGSQPTVFVRVNGRLYHWSKLKHAG